MKTLLVGISAKYIHPAVAVYSLKEYAARFVAPEEMKIKTREFTINQSYDEIYYSILAEKADVLAFSVYIWNVELVARLIKDLRKTCPTARIVLGGPEVSYGVPACIREENYDFCLCGEGERAFTALMLKLVGKAVPTEWHFAQSGKNYSTAPIDDLDELPFIYDGAMEAFSNRIIYYEASRGCPFNCTYCLSAAERGLRIKSAEKVLIELRYLVDHGARLIKFLDRSFNARADLALAILNYIAGIPSDNPIRFHFELEADTLAPEVIEAFTKMPAGRVQLEIGIQSTNPATLKAVHRNPDTARLFQNIRSLQQNQNMKVHVDLIAGLPYEMLKEFKQSFNDVFGLYAHELQLGFLKRLQGAPLADEAEWGNVFSDAAPYEILQNKYISAEDMGRLKRIEDVLDRFYNSGRFANFFADTHNPWTLFEDLANFVETKNLAFQPLGAIEEFNLLAEFAPDKKTALLKDFYAFTSSDQVPESLAPLAQKPKDAAEQASALLKKAGHRERKLMCRFVEGQAYLFDYTQKDSVTERFLKWT